MKNISSGLLRCYAGVAGGKSARTAASAIAALFFFMALFLPLCVNAADGIKSLPEKHTLRPVSKFKVVIPYSDISRVFSGNKMVMIDYEELDGLVEKNNKMIADRYAGVEDKKKKPRPPVDCIINSAAYKFVKDRDNVLGALDIDFSILTDKYVLVPLIAGPLALNDAVIDDTIPVIISEPVASPPEVFTDVENQVRQGVNFSRNNINAVPLVQSAGGDFNAPAAISRTVRGVYASSRYSLLVMGEGRHTLSIRFLLTPDKDGARYSFSIGVPDSPRNNVLFMHDAADAIIKMTPAVGGRLFVHSETKKQAYEADFGFSDRLDFSFYAITPEEKKMADAADVKTSDGSLLAAGASGADAGTDENGLTNALAGAVRDDNDAPGPVKYETEQAAVSCNIKSVYSIGDGIIRGSHDITFNIIKGQMSKFSLEMPIDTDIDEVLTDNYDRRQIRQVRTPGGIGDYSSVEVFLKYPVTNEFNLTLTSITKIDEATDEINMPELSFHSLESERGYIAVCALTNVKIGLAGEPFNLERIDAQELPERIRFSVVSPILFAFKYYKHPYRARLKLTKYSDSRVLASVLTAASVNTFITGQGRAVSSCEYDIKNNGMPFLKLMPEDTVEILDGALVNNKLVKVSYDQDYNFKIPIVKSNYVNDNTLQYPVKFKTSTAVNKLASLGDFTLRLPRAEIPAMHLKWRVYTTDGYVFYNMRGAPDLKQPPAVPLIYQIPLNFINAVVFIYKSPDALSIMFILFIMAVIAFTGYIFYIGGEKAYETGVFGAIWNIVYNSMAAVFGFLANRFVSVMIVIMVFGILAAISVPNFNRARHQAKSKSCIGNMKTIEGAAELYLMEKGDCDAPDVQTLGREGYLRVIPRCPDGYDYRINLIAGIGGKIDVICPKHGSLLMQDNDKEKGFGSSQMNVVAPAPSSIPMPQSSGGRRRMEESAVMNDKMDSLSEDESVLMERKDKAASKLMKSKKNVIAERVRSASRARPENRGIFSVPVALPKTGHSNLVEKKFIMSGEEVVLRMSYMSVKLYRALVMILFITGLLIPFAASRALYKSSGAFLYAIAGILLLLVLEAANYRMPDTARASQLGILAGIIIFALSKTIAKLSNPRVLKSLAGMVAAPAVSTPSSPLTPPDASAPSVSAGPAPLGPASGEKDKNGGSGGRLTLIIIALFVSLLLAAAVIPRPACAAPPYSPLNSGLNSVLRHQPLSPAASIELNYNPATLEVQTFYMLDMAMRSNEKKVLIPYDDLKHLIDSVNSMEYMADTKEITAPAAPPYRAMIKKASITGDIKTDAADLTIEYFIDVFDENYSTVELIGGDIALKSIETFFIKPYNFGFYGMSGDYISKLEQAYKEKGAREKLNRYRNARSFETIARYDNFKINPESRKYSALFEGAGEYMVKISFKTNVIAADNSYHFELYPARCACMKISLATPREYDLIADNMIVESRSIEGEGAAARNITAGGLIPNSNYIFRLTLAEQARRERERARLAEERRLEEIRERMRARKSEEVTIITKKIEPRITLMSASRLTVDEERFCGLSEWNYNVQNTELRELFFEIPANTMITLVEGSGIYDWKVTEPADTGNSGGGTHESSISAEAGGRVLKVMFKNPVRGQFNLKVGFETSIFDMKSSVSAPFIRPEGVDEHRGYLAVDSAVNAEVSVTGEVEANLVAIDEKEIPGLPEGYASSSILYAYKFSKRPGILSFEIKKHIDIAAIACAIDIANYKTFVTREGNLITSAYYEIRNNNVQFLELRLPPNSEPWSLKVGERLFKPGAGVDGTIYIPLLKSPDDGHNFMPFAVTLVYFTKMRAFSLFGGGRIELPRPGVLCSKVDWELHFIDDYNIYNINTNMRRQQLKSGPEYMDQKTSPRAATVSIDQMLNIQYSKMAATNVRPVTQPAGEQSYVTSSKSGAARSGSYVSGAVSKSKMPVSLDVPSTSNLHYFTAESLEKVENAAESTIFYAGFSYYSKPVYDIAVLMGYLLGVFLVLSFLRALFRAGSYKFVIVLAVISVIYVSALEYATSGTVEYFMFGFVMAAILFAAQFIVRLNEEERRILKLK